MRATGRRLQEDLVDSVAGALRAMTRGSGDVHLPGTLCFSA